MAHKMNSHKSALRCSFWFRARHGPRQAMYCISITTFMRQSGEEFDALETNLSNKSSSICVAEFAEHPYHSRSRLGSKPVKFGFKVWGALKKTETPMAAKSLRISKWLHPNFPRFRRSLVSFGTQIWGVQSSNRGFKTSETMVHTAKDNSRSNMINWQPLQVGICTAQCKSEGLGNLEVYSRRQGKTWQTLDSRQSCQQECAKLLFLRFRTLYLNWFCECSCCCSNPAQCPDINRGFEFVYVCVLFRVGDLRVTLMQGGCRW